MSVSLSKKTDHWTLSFLTLLNLDDFIMPYLLYRLVSRIRLSFVLTSLPLLVFVRLLLLAHVRFVCLYSSVCMRGRSLAEPLLKSLWQTVSLHETTEWMN